MSNLTIESIKGGIGQLAKSAERYAEELRGQGYNVDIDIFKMGRGACSSHGVSYITLHIEKLNAQGETIVYEYFDIQANGYGTVGTWKELKTEMNAILKKV